METQGGDPPLSGPEAAPKMTALDMAGEELILGQKVWAENAGHLFIQGSFRAEVIEAHRPAQPGMVWLRQLPTVAQPYVGEEGGWVTEWPAKDVLGR